MRTAIARSTRRTLVAAVALFGLASSATAAGTGTAGQVRAGRTNAHRLYVGLNDNWVVVDGDGSTDLDCWVYDKNGRLVGSDTDSTDTCVLETPGIGNHRVVVKNYGSVTNYYDIEQYESLR